MSYSEKEQKIIKQVLSGEKISVIAEQNRISMQTLYDFLEKYCKENHVRIVQHLNSKEIVPEEERKNKRAYKSKALEIVKQVEEWCKENKRFPKGNSNVYVAPKEEQGTDKETPEQLEKRIHSMFFNLKARMDLKYGALVEIDTIEDEKDRETVKRLRELEWKYFKDKEIIIHCKNAVELRQWCKEHKRLPKTIKNVEFAKNQEEETEEQKEVRMYYAMIELEGKYLDLDIPLQDKVGAREKELQISYLLKDLLKTYSVTFVRDERKFSSVNRQQLAKAILNLVHTRKATIGEIRKIAEYYNIDIEEVFATKFFKDDNERDD